MPISVAATSHKGLIRSVNEDSFAATGLDASLDGGVVSSVQSDDAYLLAVVADGLGGHPAGDVASSLVVSNIMSAQPSSGSELVEAVHAANTAVYDKMSQPTLGMGSTVAAVLITSDGVAVVHVGDSPVFEFFDGRLTQVTIDDVSGSKTVLPGVPTASLSQALGGSNTFKSVTPTLTLLEPEAGAHYLLCTDGLSSVLPKHQIAEALAISEVSAGARSLMKQVLKAGAPDNITLVLIKTRNDAPPISEGEEGTV